MKTLDFSKPLRVVGRFSGPTPETIEVVKEGLTLVRDSDNCVYVVDEHGTVQKTQAWNGDGGLYLENVPSPKKDHLHLYQTTKGEWRVNACHREQLETREFWEENGDGGIVVKVPS